MTKNFKDASEEFQEVMKKLNNKLVTTEGQILPDSDAEKYRGSKGVSEYNKEKERIAKEVERLTKEIDDDVAPGLIEIENEDNIISPNHYASDKGFEVFDVQEAFIHELKGMSASYWCNIVKYILRFQKKNGVEDLKKAKYYLERLIEEES